MPVIGFLGSTSPDTWTRFERAFQQGLNEIGFTDGKNVQIEYRWAEGQIDRLPELAADLMQRRVAVIFASGGQLPVLAAKAATVTTPIIFAAGGDPVGGGLVASLNKPGGNITGIMFFNTELVAKRIELMHELLPSAAKIAVLGNPNSWSAQQQLFAAQEAARTLGRELFFLSAGTQSEIDGAFAILARQRADALVFMADPLFLSRRDQIVALVTHMAIPAIYNLREFVVSGGLMSYGTSITDAHRQAGIYVGRVLKGEKPADLPVMQPTKFDLVINLKTAKVLDLTIPSTLLARADEVIE
jgi:putative ABC transport system substrate-binding protein